MALSRSQGADGNAHAREERTEAAILTWGMTSTFNVSFNAAETRWEAAGYSRGAARLTCD